MIIAATALGFVAILVLVMPWIGWAIGKYWDLCIRIQRGLR